jgi:tocopherol O-methyltransferase
MPKTKDLIIDWYEKKTQNIIDKYGPGPVIHFHTGIIDPVDNPEKDSELLRLQLVKSQEKLLQVACDFWGSDFMGSLLDFGCGLGGGSIYFAKEFGVTVYALTNVPSHIKYLQQFAIQAGVADRVIPIRGNHNLIPGDNVFGAVVAIESSCYVNRVEWFNILSSRLKSGGKIYIADSFTKSPEVKKPFDDYWLTDIGTLQEYRKAAAISGFRVDAIKDITESTSRFWEFSVLHSRMELEKKGLQKERKDKLLRSIEWQTRLEEFWKDRMINCMLLKLSLPS